MSTRWIDRLAGWFSIVLLGVLAAGSYYLAELAQRADGPRAGARPSDKPDYFVEHFVVTRLNPAGVPVARLSAERLEHFPVDDSVRYRLPVLVSLDADKPRVELRAERGESDAGGRLTKLSGAVVLTRAADGDRAELRVETDYAEILSEPEIARTDRRVVVTQGASSLTGVGMEFDNAARVLTVASRVQGRWVSATPPAPGRPQSR